VIGERFERQDGWIGEVTSVRAIGWAGFVVSLRNVNNQDPPSVDITDRELGMWRNCGPAVEDIAKRHGFQFYGTVEEASGGKP
jgi:hypothetical protein